jgi:hypothetical protein
MFVLQYLAADFVKTCLKKRVKWLNHHLKPDFEPLPFCHFLTDLSLVYMRGNAIESSFRISKSYVGIAMAANYF